MDYEYKLFEFNIYTRPAFDENIENTDGEDGEDEEGTVAKKDANIFAIQMFGTTSTFTTKLKNYGFQIPSTKMEKKSKN